MKEGDYRGLHVTRQTAAFVMEKVKDLPVLHRETLHSACSQTLPDHPSHSAVSERVSDPAHDMGFDRFEDVLYLCPPDLE